MDGINGGSESAVAVLANNADKRVLESMLHKSSTKVQGQKAKDVELMRGFEQVVSWFLDCRRCRHTYTSLAFPVPSAICSFLSPIMLLLPSSPHYNQKVGHLHLSPRWRRWYHSAST